MSKGFVFIFGFMAGWGFALFWWPVYAWAHDIVINWWDVVSGAKAERQRITKKINDNFERRHREAR